MNSDTPRNEESVAPISSFCGPVSELIGGHLLSPPPCPGVFATLGRFEILRILGGGEIGRAHV